MMVFPLKGLSGKALDSSDLLQTGLLADATVGSDFFRFLTDSDVSESVPMVDESVPIVDESRVRFETSIDSLPEFESDERDMDRVSRGCSVPSADTASFFFLLLLPTFPEGEFAAAGAFPPDCVSRNRRRATDRSNFVWRLATLQI
jgi:hypothetical protein